jgi:hypothetical protein
LQLGRYQILKQLASGTIVETPATDAAVVDAAPAKSPGPGRRRPGRKAASR